MRPTFDLPRRRFHEEPLPPSGGVEVFSGGAPDAINKARMDHLLSLGLDLQAKRVLDVGCGVGHFSSIYTSRGCRVVGVDGRADNIAVMARLYPEVKGHVHDVQADDLTSLGEFDIVHCYGLLYHLDSPIAAIRNMERVCREILVLETIVVDSAEEIMVLVDEPKTFNQALAGLGCRPSPKFVAMALNRAGFDHVAMPLSRPRHPDFEQEWLNDGAHQRNGVNLRAVFVASRTELGLPSLAPVLRS